MRKYCEGVVASLFIAGIDFAFAGGLFLRNRGTFREALMERGILEEWSALMALAGVALTTSILARGHKTLRHWALILNIVMFGGTYTMLWFFVPGLVFSPFGNVVLLSSFASLALFWLHERETHRAYPSGGEGAGQTRTVAPR